MGDGKGVLIAEIIIRIDQRQPVAQRGDIGFVAEIQLKRIGAGGRAAVDDDAVGGHVRGVGPADFR